MSIVSEKGETAGSLSVSVLAKLLLRKRRDNQTIRMVSFTVITTGLNYFIRLFGYELN